jgi:ABC-type Fe3+-hydroxamate transport system substrate-binding protein
MESPVCRVIGRRVSASRVVLLLLVSLSLGGCSVVSSFVVPGTFNEVYEARDELDLATAGEIQAEDDRGGGVWFDGKPTHTVIVAGADVYSVVEARLEAEGYTNVTTDFDSTTWDRGSHGDYIHITLQTVAAGDVIELGDDGDVSVDNDGVSVYISGTRG